MLSDLFGQATLVLLLLTAAVLSTSLVRRRTRQMDFPFLMMLFVIGWFSTDLLSSAVAEQWQSLVSFGYMVILVGFLGLMVRRLGWASTQSRKMRHGVDEEPGYGDEITP